MVTRIMMSVSQNEIERTSERTKVGMTGAIKQGHIPAICPIGFKRVDKADIIMRYIDDVELEIKNGKLVVKQINFRSTFYNDFNELYTKGYIDRKRPLTYDFNGLCVDTNIRYSEYLPIKDVMQHLYRLNEYYEVNLYKGTYYKETEKLDIGPLQRNEVPIRVFPLQKDNNGDKNWLSMGMLATKNNPNDIKVNIRDVFETIPDNVTEEDF